MRLLRIANLSVLIVGALVGAGRGDQLEPAPSIRALVDAGSFVEAEARARERFRAAVETHGPGSIEWATAADTLVEVLLRNGRGASTEARSLAERALRAKERLVTPEHTLVDSLLNDGQTRLESGDTKGALSALQRAVAVRERQAAGSSLETAEALDALAMALTASDRFDDALRALQRSLANKESALPATDVRIARTLELLAITHQRKGAYAAARGPLERALEIQESADPRHPAMAEALNLLGLQLWFEGRVPDARETWDRALRLAQSRLRPDHPTIALILRSFAWAVQDLGEPARAIPLLERALAIAEGAYGETHAQTADYLNDLAGPTLILGAYPAARALYQRALRIAEVAFGRWHDRVATAVYNLALVDHRIGDYASARDEYARAVSVWERVYGRSHPFVAVALTELAELYADQGQMQQGLPLLERALAIREQSLGLRHPEVAKTLIDLASTRLRLGDRASAQDAADRALRISESLALPDAPDLATVLALQGRLALHRSDGGGALTNYQRAMAIRERAFGAQHPAVADAQAGVAQALALQGDLQAAVRAAIEAEATGRGHLRTTLRYLPERQSLTYAATRARGLDLALSLVAANSDTSSVAFDGIVKSRALVLDEVAARRAAGPQDAAETTRLRSAFVAAQQRVANLVVRGAGQLAEDRYAALVNDARREAEAAEREFAAQSATFREERRQEQIGVADVARAIPPDAALLSFVKYERSSFGQPPAVVEQRRTVLVAPRTVPSYVAFVLQPNQTPIAVPLGAASRIDDLVARWRQDVSLEAIGAATPTGVRQSARVTGTALRALVWDPVVPHLTSARRVFVVPDGSLGLVPFVALPVGQRDYLIEHAPVLHYLSTERDLVRDRPMAQTNARGLLALGGPAFDAAVGDQRSAVGDQRSAVGDQRSAIGDQRSAQSAGGVVRRSGVGCADLQGVTFQALTGSLQEVRDVAGVWRGSGHLESSSAQLLVGAEASEVRFKRQAPGHRILHLATHGFFLGDSCVPTGSGTRAIGGLVTASGRAPARTTLENPLHLSGLAFAGANRRASARVDEEDGILTAEEVASLNLHGVEWAVLSACDTGVGAVQAGEGVFGLRRAFQIAGARTVVMSLWSVDDHAARTWMHALYDGRLQRNLDTADAVHAASLATLADRRARGQSTLPFFWAAFVAVGDWN